MKTASIIGTALVTLALLFYSIGFFKEKGRKLVSATVLTFYTLGLTLDITATVFMIIGSSKGLITVHGLIGYSSLLGMLTDTIILWRFNLKNGSAETVSKPIHVYSRIAYIWWVLAYITGGLLVTISKLNS